MKLLPFALLGSLLLAGRAAASPQPGLPAGNPEAEGVDSRGVLAMVDSLEQTIDSVHSFVLVRHGKVVAQGWWNPYRPEDVHLLYSGTKSFVSTAVGFAVQEHLLSINDLVISFFPEYAPEHPAEQMKRMRIRDLLIMSSGHEKDTINRLRESKDGSWIRTFLATDVEHKPGTHFQYNSGGTYMLAAIVQKVTGKTVEDYLQPRLFGPLGITRHPWAMSSEGVDLGDGGLSITTGDFAKFGQFYLQKGAWEGTQLLPSSWVTAATSKETSSGSDPDDNWESGYGYQFWMNKVGGFRADGANGQFCFVLPQYDLVLAMTSGTDDMKSVMNVVWRTLLPALHEGPLPPNPSALDALRQRLDHLELKPQEGAQHATMEPSVSGKTYLLSDNEMGLRSAAISFSAQGASLVFTDGDGRHEIPCGSGAWTRSRTGFEPRITNIFRVPEHGVAASGAWTSADTYVAQLWFYETPFRITATFRFSGDRLHLRMKHNIAWGDPKKPDVEGVVQTAP